MEDLRLVGVHEDGEYLLLASPSGQRFRLHADEALRAAVRRDRARLGQLQIETDGGLRPREIQSRIRAGQTAEEVAADAGVPIERVRRYEGPVIAERQFVAQQARAVRLRRATSAGGTSSANADTTLGEVVTDRLGARDVDLARIEWDAWRAEDGTWTVTLDFTAGDRARQARWTYDAAVRHAVPLDDEAVWLSGDEPASTATRRLVPVREQPDDEPRSAPSAEDSAAHDLLDTLALRRGRRQAGTVSESGGPDPVREAIDVLRTARSDTRTEARRLDERPEPTTGYRDGGRASTATATEAARSPKASRDVVVLPDTENARSAQGGQGAPSAGTHPSPSAHTPQVSHSGQGTSGSASSAAALSGRAKAPARGRRPSVPSWDDIVFGSRRE